MAFQLETDKNKLENLLKNNLLKKKERLTRDLEEWSSEDRKQKLEMNRSEMDTVNTRVNENNSRFKGK